ncbi:hypothetical protein V6N13_065123 [Hibiscus sabdariffa]
MRILFPWKSFAQLWIKRPRNVEGISWNLVVTFTWLCETCISTVEVTDLGDQVFFVSTDCSFSFSTQDSKGCHGNCIIYVDEITDVEHLENKERYEEDDDDNELWHLKNGRVGLFNLADQSSGSLELFPEYLAMFWPPPTWLMGDQASSSS